MRDIEEFNEFDELEVNSRFLSECCGAPIYGEICGDRLNQIGICSHCKEWSGVVKAEEKE